MELYLLSIEELGTEKIGELAFARESKIKIEESGDGNAEILPEQLRERALRLMDSHRREKAQHLKAGAPRDLAIGAGLLLQLAARRARGEQFAFADIKLVSLSVQELLGVLEERGEPVQIRYRHGELGKPDFADGSWHFNLSHSGQYVCCALAQEEIGVDIQRMLPLKNMRLSERFFADREKEALRACTDEEERQKLFYRLWVRKEAYAKLTGEGIVRSVKMDVDTLMQDVLCEEYSVAEEYCLAVCRYGNVTA